MSITVHPINRNWGCKIYEAPGVGIRRAYVYKGGCVATGILTAACDGLPSRYGIEEGRLVCDNNPQPIPRTVLAQVKKLLLGYVPQTGNLSS